MLLHPTVPYCTLLCPTAPCCACCCACSLQDSPQGLPPPLTAPPHPLLAVGVRDLRVLKTTQSGYEGFLRDQYTLLPEVRDRIMATSVTATWKVC